MPYSPTVSGKRSFIVSSHTDTVRHTKAVDYLFAQTQWILYIPNRTDTVGHTNALITQSHRHGWT